MEFLLNVFGVDVSCRTLYTIDSYLYVSCSKSITGPRGSVVEHPLRDREVVDSNPGCAIPKALKMVPVATLLGAQYYKASTGFSSPHKYRTTNNATLNLFTCAPVRLCLISWTIKYTKIKYFLMTDSQNESM